LTVMQGQLDAMEADQRPWMKIEKLALSRCVRNHKML
jgi:hypothetical protein